MQNISANKKNFIDSTKKYSGFEIGPKFKLKEWNHNIISIQPIFATHYRQDLLSKKLWQLKFLFGKYKYTSLGKTFDTLEITPALSNRSWECSVDYTTGLERQNGVILMIQSSNKLSPKENKLYQKTSLLQFGVAKALRLGNYAEQRQVTVQVAYLREMSISGRKMLMSGVNIAAWVDI